MVVQWCVTSDDCIHYLLPYPRLLRSIPYQCIICITYVYVYVVTLAAGFWILNFGHFGYGLLVCWIFIWYPCYVPNHAIIYHNPYSNTVECIHNTPQKESFNSSKYVCGYVLSLYHRELSLYLERKRERIQRGVYTLVVGVNIQSKINHWGLRKESTTIE